MKRIVGLNLQKRLGCSFIVFIHLLSVVSYAQVPNIIHGTIKDRSDTLLMGNALLFSKVDSSLIKGTFFLNGHFELSCPKNIDAWLKITSMGYKDTIIVIEKNRMPSDLGVIYLQNKFLKLDEVTVKAVLPIFEQNTNGTTKANVENTILSHSSSTMYMLSKLPNLLVEDNRVLVVGKGEAIIYLNGKQINTNQLSALQVSSIRNVEIINNPSAKYDAQGKAVVNIVTIENQAEGIQGKLTQRSIFGKNPLSYTSASINWRRNKWSIASDYGINFGKDWGSNLLTREILNNVSGIKSVNDWEDNSQSKYIANYHLGTKYQLNKRSNVAIEYLGTQNIKNQNSKASTLFVNSSEIQTTINTHTTGELNNMSNALNINYYNLIDTLGTNLFFGGQYSSFSSDDNSFIDETIEKAMNNKLEMQLNKSSSKITFATAQFDVEKYYVSGIKIDFGAKVVNARNLGEINFFSKQYLDNDYTPIPDLTNDFKYVENLVAAYVQMSDKLKNNLSYSFGLRSEFTGAKGQSLSLSQTAIDSIYINFFPTASLQLQINKKMKWGISFTSRLNRPSYQDLNPFLYYIDSLTSRQGNPNLKPEYLYSTESSLSLKGYQLKLGYTFTQNPFRNVMIGGNHGPNSTILKQINMQSQNSYYVSLTIPLVYRKFNSYNILGATLDQTMDNRPEFHSDGSAIRPYFYSRNSLIIDPVGKLELNAQYMGKRFDGIYYRKSFYTVSLGLSRSFVGKKLNCSLLVNDIFHSFEVDGYYKLSSSKVSYLRKFDSYYYQFTILYNFGKLKEVNYKSQNVGEETDKRIQK